MKDVGTDNYTGSTGFSTWISLTACSLCEGVYLHLIHALSQCKCALFAHAHRNGRGYLVFILTLVSKINFIVEVICLLVCCRACAHQNEMRFAWQKRLARNMEKLNPLYFQKLLTKLFLQTSFMKTTR